MGKPLLEHFRLRHKPGLCSERHWYALGLWCAEGGRYFAFGELQSIDSLVFGKPLEKLSRVCGNMLAEMSSRGPAPVGSCWAVL